MKKILLALAFGLAVSACSTEPVRTPPIQLDFNSLGKVYLNVQDVNIINRAASESSRAPDVSNQFQPTLADAATRWAQDRLQAIGRVGHATFIIKEASLKEYPLKTPTGFESWFKREQASKYIGRIEVGLEAQSPVNNAVGSATAHAVYAVTLPEDPTDAEKNAAYREVLDALMHDLNQKFEQAIRDHMAPFVTSSPSPGMVPSYSTARPILLPPATYAPVRR